MKSSFEGSVLQKVSVEAGRRRNDLTGSFHHGDVGPGFQILERDKSKHEYYHVDLHDCFGLCAVMFKKSLGETTDPMMRGVL